MTLSHEEARSFYDRFGAKQDWQRFYEDRAIADVITHASFEEAQAVVEFGCGTGRLAALLLERHLPGTARYLALDMSTTMVALAAKRLVRFGPRAEVRHTSGEMQLQVAAGTCDRFLSTYVLDLLSEEDIRSLLAEAYRVLCARGILALVSLTHGCTLLSRLVEKTWRALYAIRPRSVGGCRPISLLEFVDNRQWEILHRAQVVQFAVASEVVVAERVA